MRPFRPGAFLASLGILLLTGCGLPHPFAPEARTPQEQAALLPPHGQGVWVGDFHGLPAEQSVRVAGTLLAALHAEGIPASAANRNEASFVLNGAADVTGDDPERVRIVLRWTLTTAAGETVGTVEETNTLPKARWENDARPLDRLALSAAGKIARLARGDEPRPPPPPAVAVWPVDGAPGDGRRALTFAVRTALADAGIPLARAGQEPGLILLGGVELDAAEAGQQEARLNWSLIRPDGETVGAFTQVNRIAAGRMDGPWGILASAIAAGTAEGVAALIERMADEKPAETQ
ncbi:MAG: hypothetical protein J4G10_02045 [Alphaproteobacteria bacterium]|nr:hypothetical protein [Alphaproteobacteria bacterium]